MPGDVIIWSYIRTGKNAEEKIILLEHILLKSKEDGRANICSSIEKPIHNQNTWFCLLKETFITEINR